MAEGMLLSRSAKEAHLKRAFDTASRSLADATVAAACYKAVVDPYSLVPHYDWFGFYRLEGDDLVLEYFLGEPTEHVRIRVGKGICGSAAAKGRNIVVEDVERERNYLACSPDVRSEIVVLVRDPFSGKLLGELDADSHELAAFDEMDERALTDAARVLADRLAALAAK